MEEDVVDNRAKNQFELEMEGHKAVATYERAPGLITFTHTLVPDALAGRGVGSRLVREALAQARAQGLKVVPQCPFVHAYIGRHPEEQDLLA